MSAPNLQQPVKGTQQTPSAPPTANANGEENNQKSVEKSLQKENKRLRGDIKQMEVKVKTIQGELKKSNQVKDRLEALCRELQKQNRFIKAESTAKITEANQKGKELAQEVQSNMGFIKNINENLASITSETMQVRKENEELAKKISTLKAHYEEREQVMKTVIDETSSALQQARLELGELKLKNAQEREKLLGEMQQLSQALIQSREQMKEAKETEISLRLLLQNYDEKFNGLQTALKDTNGAYEEFKSEMTRVNQRTKDLEKETKKWQARWEESTIALKLMKENHAKLQGELTNSEQSLEKMKSLCRALQLERKDLLEELKHKAEGKSKELLEEVRRAAGQSQELLDEVTRRIEEKTEQAKSESEAVIALTPGASDPPSKEEPAASATPIDPSPPTPTAPPASEPASSETPVSSEHVDSVVPVVVTTEPSSPPTPVQTVAEETKDMPPPTAPTAPAPSVPEPSEEPVLKEVVESVATVVTTETEPLPPSSAPVPALAEETPSVPIVTSDKEEKPAEPQPNPNPEKSEPSAEPAPTPNAKAKPTHEKKETGHSPSKKGKKKGKK